MSDSCTHKRDRQTDRQTADRQTYIYADRQIDRQIDRRIPWSTDLDLCPRSLPIK